MERMSRDSLHMQIALLYAQRGTCERLKVGAVLTKENRIVAAGYNGPPINQLHCSENTCDIDKPCTRAVHAEANVIAFCAKKGISTDGCTLFVTASPCIKCAELIIQAGITRVIFGEPFRNTDGLYLLNTSGVLIQRAHFIKNNLNSGFVWQGLIPWDS